MHPIHPVRSTSNERGATIIVVALSMLALALDPDATWDPVDNEVVGSAWDSWAGSPRVGIVPTFDPARFFRPGRKDIVFTNFIAVFFESVSGNGNNQQVSGRILYATGIGGGEATAPGAKFVQLIE